MAPYIIIIIMKRISRAPIYRTRCEHRALYKRTRTRTYMRMRARALRTREYIGTAVRNNFEMTIEQVCLEGGFKRGGTIRVAECLRQIVPNRWASVRKKDLQQRVTKRAAIVPR